MFGLLSQYWLDEHHADGEVLLATNRFTEQQQGCDPQQVVARIPIHCIVVSSASPYFAALLGSAWQQQAATQRTAVQLVLPDAADAAAMVALLKCIYTGELDISAADIQATLRHSSAGSSNAMQECFASQLWQQLYLRVIRLADQYAVHGVLNVAVNKLASLFSHQVCNPIFELVSVSFNCSDLKVPSPGTRCRPGYSIRLDSRPACSTSVTAFIMCQRSAATPDNVILLRGSTVYQTMAVACLALALCFVSMPTAAVAHH
jgi:hypothetical protein